MCQDKHDQRSHGENRRTRTRRVTVPAASYACPRSSAMLFPPSTTRQCPVTYAAPGEQRKAMGAATSIADPLRPHGVLEPSAASAGAWLGVAIHPGATAFAVPPSAAWSTATALARPSMPAFAAAYAASPRIAITGPVTDATMTTRP